jgi:nitrate/nitrite transport system substrate-binding protein
MANKEEMCRIVGKRSWFNVPVADILARSRGDYNLGNGRSAQASPHFQKYWRDFASYPFQSHDLWFLVENQRWGKLEAGADLKGVIGKVNREDLWREAAKELGVAAAEIPASTSRGPETFFDGKVFDPASPEVYLMSLGIKRLA